METTLNKIWKQRPCGYGWEKLNTYLGPISKDDPVKILTILESNGFDDALWAIRAVDGYDRELRLFGCWCACQSLYIFEREHPGDMRPRQAIETTALYAEGLASAAATDAASAASNAASWAAASAAAWDAARTAAWGAQEKEFLSMCTLKKGYMPI